MDIPRVPGDLPEYVPGGPDDPAERQFIFRVVTDPVFISTWKDARDTPEFQAMIADLEAECIGNAQITRDAYRRVTENARIMKQPVFLSIRDVETGQTVSIEEVRLIAAIFCED